MGKIIALSGFDGAGKSTQISMMLEWFKSNMNYKTISIYDLQNPEDYNDISDLDYYYDKLKEYDVIGVRFYLNSPKNRVLQRKVMYENVFKDSELVKETASVSRTDANNWFSEVILKLYKEGKIILFDRYFFDEIAYRSLYSVEKEWLENLYTNFIKPDMSFYIKLPLEKIKERNSVREDAKTQLYNNMEKLDELYGNLDYVSQKFNMIEVDGNNSMENINKFIIDNIKRII